MSYSPKTFITSDNHFYHEKIIWHCKRPFNSVNHMNEHMIKMWNDVVSYNDIVFHLGDFIWTNEHIKLKSIRNILDESIEEMKGFL